MEWERYGMTLWEAIDQDGAVYEVAYRPDLNIDRPWLATWTDGDLGCIELGYHQTAYDGKLDCEHDAH